MLHQASKVGLWFLKYAIAILCSAHSTSAETERLSGVEPWDLTADLRSHPQTLYAQSFRITLASCIP
ncbi:hypothetical protein KP509_20G004400 [Ceratopteris richardii]|uniref:Uncharacterized protein n=1 Tax=Ceratopteris richardii TaxID=49495 RepID=A0A8T2SFL2_CERRI|nr:hypothetical protein KP509_20G004400 [Ceratopteris richardii]